jgi:hypothetical protein
VTARCKRCTGQQRTTQHDHRKHFSHQHPLWHPLYSTPDLYCTGSLADAANAGGLLGYWGSPRSPGRAPGRS